MTAPYTWTVNIQKFFVAEDPDASESAGSGMSRLVLDIARHTPRTHLTSALFGWKLPLARPNFQQPSSRSHIPPTQLQCQVTASRVCNFPRRHRLCAQQPCSYSDAWPRATSACSACNVQSLRCQCASKMPTSGPVSSATILVWLSLTNCLCD